MTTTQLERIENELKLAGYKLQQLPQNTEWTDEDYVQHIGYCAWEICKKFCEQDHSGMSAQITFQIIKVLLDGGILTPLTDNPDEWVTHDTMGRKYYQSKRNFSCFSDDELKTYYNIDAEENRVYELDKDGNKTSRYTFVGTDKVVKHELKKHEM